MLKSTIIASALAALLLVQPCLGNTLKAAPGQQVGGEMMLGGEVQSDLFIDAPAEVSGWMLNPSEPASKRQISLTVFARTCWQLSVSSDRKSGRMAEFDPLNSSYIIEGKELENPLIISADGTADHPDDWEVDLSKGGIIQEDEETAGEKQKLDVEIEQAVSWMDEPLPDSRSYHTILIFKISGT